MEEQPRAVVVVDDEPDILWILGDVLETEGYRVLPVDHPDLVESLDPEEPPSLFVLDLLLPVADGLELARTLHEEGFSGVPMIAISAHAAMLKAARDSGLFQSVLAKPFDTSDLVLAVRAATRGHTGDGPDE